MIKSW